MKKLFIVLATVTVSAGLFSGCLNFSSGNKSKNYKALNDMLDANYSKVKITLTDTFDDDTWLKSEYTITYSESNISVKYAVERFSEISIDNPTDEVKVIKSGEAIISGTEISFTGDKIELSADIAKLNFKFEEEYFTDAKLTNTSFVAAVKKPSEFYGSQIICNDMSVNSTFSDVFDTIKIKYTTYSGSKIEQTYIFTV